MKRLSEIEIARQLAAHTAKRITRRTITALQRLTDCKLSGDDSMLANVWDEICAQVQYEESLAWDVYLETVTAMLSGEVDGLAAHEREALWLQTEQGSDWDCEDEDDRDPYPVDLDEIVEYLLHDYVLAEAGSWSNARIRAYLDWSSQRD